MEQALRDRLREYFLSKREEMRETLFSLIRIPSVAASPSEGKPYGEEVARALSHTASLFRERGFAATLDPEGRYLTVRFGEGERTIGLFAHADVVPGGEGWLLTSPFEPVEQEGLWVGRGAEDDKSAIVAALYLFSAIRDLEIPLRASLLLVVGGAEETGMDDIEAFAVREPMPDVSLVPDNEYPVVVGEKGRGVLRLISPPILTDILEFRGGVAENIVLSSLTVLLVGKEDIYHELREKACGREDLRLSLEGERIRLDVFGTAAHAANAAGAVNAARTAAELLQGCHTLSADDRQVMASASFFLSDYYGKTLGIACEDPLFGPLTLSCGMAAVDGIGRLHMKLDARLPLACDLAAMEAQLTELAEEDEFEFFFESVVPAFDHGDGPEAKALLEAFREATEGKDAGKAKRSGGLTYAHHLKNAYSIGIEYRKEGVSLPLPQGHGSAHEADEAITVEGFLRGLEIQLSYLLALDDCLYGM